MSYAMAEALPTGDVIDNTLKDQVYYEDGVIVKPEKRGPLTKMKQWYYKHIIQSGISAKWEQGIDFNYKLMQNVVGIAGTVASVALLFVPGGQLAAALTILATPALMGLVKLEKDLERRTLITLKRKAEEAMGFGKEGQSEKVTDADITLDEVAAGAVKIIKEAPKAVPKSGSLDLIEQNTEQEFVEEEVVSKGMR
jgi:hypothetical protein